MKCSGDGKEDQGRLPDSVAFELRVGKTRKTWPQCLLGRRMTMLWTEDQEPVHRGGKARDVRAVGAEDLAREEAWSRRGKEPLSTTIHHVLDQKL